MSTTIDLPAYQIFIGDVLSELPAIIEAQAQPSFKVLVDDQTALHCLPRLSAHLSIDENQIIRIPSGEEFKTLETSRSIWQQLAKRKSDRKTILINLGGGVIGDMGGFCASTYMRGISFIQIPTTLLSQVDASVGGKVGIDFQQIKNLIGNFCDPLAVLIDPAFLKTLPARELRSGYAEVIKHALIRDPLLWEQLKLQKHLADMDWNVLVDTSVRIKKEVVQADPFEHGLRKILNFGHTIGHAVESVMLESEDKLLHGEAIAVGMIAESYISNQLSSLKKDHLAEISQYLLEVFGKVVIDKTLNVRLIEAMRLDKKNEAGSINCSLLQDIGHASENFDVDPKLITESLNFYRSL